MESIEHRSSVLEVVFHVVVPRIQEGIPDQHQVRLEGRELFPRVAEQQVFHPVEIGLGDGYRELGIVEKGKEGVMRLAPDQDGNAAAAKGVSRSQYGRTPS